MTKYRMLAALLAGLILMSLTGCAADKETADHASDIQSQEISTANVTSDSETSDDITAEIDTESSSVTEKPAEKESDAPQNSESAAAEKPVSSPPAESEVSEASKPALSEPPKQTEPPKTEEPTSADPPVTAPPAESEPTEPPEPAFDIDYWVSYAQNDAEGIGLRLESSAVECWDNPIPAGAHCIYLERDIKGMLDKYNRDEDITDVWIWAEACADGSFCLFIGYA